MSFGDHENDDDMFKDTRMSFWDHIEELRIHMWRAIVGFLVALCFGLVVGKPMERLIVAPVEQALSDFYDQRLTEEEEKVDQQDTHQQTHNQGKEVTIALNHAQLEQLAQALGSKQPVPVREEPFQLTATIDPRRWAIATSPALRKLIRPATLATMSATEAFVVYFKVSIYCGIVIGSPWIFYQLWSFVAAGLYPHEKKAVNVYLPISVGLFLAGVALCEFLVIPTALSYLLSFNHWMQLEPDLRLNEWLSFAIWMPLSFGAAFQLPLVMLFFYRLGIINLDTYRNNRKYAYFGLFCLYLIIGASPDALSMIMLSVPLCGLYELGILLCRMSPHAEEEEMEDSDEMVEV